MDQQSSGGSRAYYAQRAAEEYELATSAADSQAAEAHRKLQRIFIERASIGERAMPLSDEIG